MLDYTHRAGEVCPRIFRSGIILVSACNQPGGDGSRGLLGQPSKVVTKAEGKVDTTGGTVLIWFFLENLGFDIWFDSVWQIPATEPPHS